MNASAQSISIFASSASLSYSDHVAQSLKSQPEASAYFDLSCEEAICDTINESLEDLDFPEFFTA